MKDGDFTKATPRDRETYVVRPNEQVPITVLVEGSNSHLVRGSNMMLSFLTMKAGGVFELHSHPEEQIMVVLEGFCDEVIEDKMYRVVPRESCGSCWASPLKRHADYPPLKGTTFPF